MDDGAREFALCRPCLIRQGAGRTGLRLAGYSECFVCGGLFGRLDVVSDSVASSLKGYEFRTFSIGLVLPPGVQEREDTLRSDLRIRGGETVKSELASSLARLVAKEMGGRRRVDRFRPDVTALVDVGSGSVEVTSRPLFLYARYTKPRGVAQRVLFCEECQGRGCDKCHGSGLSSSPSVEGLLSAKLRAELGSQKFKFTWFGSEDTESTVFPPGRPVVVEAKNPRRRLPPRALRLRSGRGGVSVSGIRVVAKGFEHPAFTFMTRVVIHAERRVPAVEVSRLQKAMRNSVVQYRNNKGKLVDKRIYFVRARARGKRITAEIKLDGGLPVKRLVSGEAVSPSFAEALQMPLRCERFDIVRVWTRRAQSPMKQA